MREKGMTKYGEATGFALLFSFYRNKEKPLIGKKEETV